ncbi:MAG: hypothetical protein Q9223_000274 [Gallowayella weberi]
MTLAGSLYRVNPNDNLTLSAFHPPLSGGLYRRGLATGDREIIWCCENSTSYISIGTPMQVWSDPGFDAVETLRLAIENVEAQVFQKGIARLPGGQWEFELDPNNHISALDIGPAYMGLPLKHLTWPVLRDGLKALSDFIKERKLNHQVRGLQFGIHSAHLQQVGKGAVQQRSPDQNATIPECHIGTDAECPGFYPDAASPECLASNAQNAIVDVGVLVYAALRALYSKSPDATSPYELPQGDISPAPHFFYFFDNNKAVANFVANIFRSILACSLGVNCPFNIVFCDNNRAWPNACQTPPGRYGYVRDPNQLAAALNHKAKGGGSMFMCPAGLALARNAAPCSQESANMGKDTLGTGLLGQIVQVDVITRPDVGFLEAHTGGWENITVLDHDVLNGSHDNTTPMAQGMTLMELGFGVNGEGLREKGLANAQNYVDFAKWSYDMNYSNKGRKCDDKFEAYRKRIGAEPVTG